MMLHNVNHNTALCQDVYLIQADHVAEASVLSGDELLRHEALLRRASSNLLLGLREVSQKPQDDPPHCHGRLKVTSQEHNGKLMANKDVPRIRTREMMN